MNKSQKILPTGKTGHGRTMAGGVATSSRRRRGRPATGHGGAAASAVGWRRLEKQANKEKSILELLFGEGKVAAAVAHLGGVKEIRDRERELPWCSRWTRKSDEIESRVHVSGRLCACVLGVRRVRVNVVLCVYASVQGVRERRECDRQRENI